MKKPYLLLPFYRLFTLCLLLCTSHFSFAQPPSGIYYQAVARDASNNPIPNTAIVVRFAIYNFANSDTVWAETHNKTTNAMGLFDARIGMGSKIGISSSKTNFSDIHWGSGNFFLRVWVDNNKMGSTRFLSVPYAMYADSANYVKTGGLQGGSPGQTLRRNAIGWMPNSLLYNNGNTIGINTTTPSALTKFHTVYDSGPPLIWGSSTTNYGALDFVVGSAKVSALGSNKLSLGAGGGSNHLVIDAAGKVGIGTAAPNAKLAIQFAGNNDGISLIGGATTNSNNMYLRFWETPVIVRATIAYLGMDKAIKISTNGSSNSRISFLTGNASAVEQMRIDANGNVGIGTTLPTAKLAIKATGVGTILGVFNSSGSLRHDIKINGGDDAVYQMIDAGGTQQIQLNTGGNSFINGGNVGIGTALPLAKLHLADGHLKSTQTNVPSFAVGSLGAFTSLTLGASSTDVKGKIIAIGSSIPPGSLSEADVTITFNVAYNSPPVVVVSPANASNAGAASFGCAVKSTANDVTIFIRNNASSGTSGNLNFNYIVIE